MSLAKIRRLSALTGLIIFAIVNSVARDVEPAYADDPLPDIACRRCHNENERQVTLPSGETLSLLVSPEVVNHSPHSSTNDSPVVCTDCHSGKVRYQYPHQPNPAQTRREFSRAVSENCQDCHYPHNPYHPEEEPGADLPVCVDCHGSHQIDYVDDILNSMPQACVRCHTDQTVQWAADFFAPRPGLGQAAEGYAGSDRCGGCHEEIYLTWRNTRHAKMIQDPAADPAVIMGDFNQLDPVLTFERNDVKYTIGSRWKQQYLAENENGGLVILPAQWHVETEEWLPYNLEPDQNEEWLQACGSCHVTGLNARAWGFKEIGIGCESCHGPGDEHATNPEEVKLFKEIDDQVCGACHSRGTSPQGHPFPATYRPGDTLAGHFAFTTDPADIWPDGSARRNHQQYMDWQLGSAMTLSPQVNCVTCHAVHDNGAERSQLVAPINEVCLACHGDKRAIIRHVPYHERASAQHEFVCSDCHMPPMATSAETRADDAPYEIHNHAFLQPNPQASLEHGGLEAMPNACHTCHAGQGEDPQWAAETILYARAVATPVLGAAFGPGPTPTPPLPPTPIPSVGQEPDVELYRVEGGRWLRNIVYTIFGLILLGVVLLGYLVFKARRSNHV
jgi:predicted CXXCH cytochrome family protein